MSDHIDDPEKPAPHPEKPFSEKDIKSFDDDDVSAGVAIGKMLSTLFVYTVIAMTIVSVWTYCNQAGSDSDVTKSEVKNH